MRYQDFGTTGMRVSQLTLGTWGIGGAGWDSHPESSRLDAIRAAIDCGINFIDTAPAYNAGEAERHVGRTLQELGVRHEVFISTKCGNEYIDGAYVRSCDSAKIRRQCDESLRNLRTDYIDLYIIHWPDPKVPFGETMDVLNDLKKQGKILHIGVSNFSREQIEEASQFGLIEGVQPQFSMVERGNEELMRWCAGQGIGVMAYGALGGGILTGAYRELRSYAPADSRNRFYQQFKEPLFSRVQRLLLEMDRLSAGKGVPLSQIAINWCAQQEFVSTCLVGAQSRRKVEENCACFGWQLTPEERTFLDEAIQSCMN